MWLTFIVIKVQGNNYYTTIWVEGSPHMWLTCMVINMQGNNYYTTIWMEGALMCRHKELNEITIHRSHTLI